MSPTICILLVCCLVLVPLSPLAAATAAANGASPPPYGPPRVVPFPSGRAGPPVVSGAAVPGAGAGVGPWRRRVPVAVVAGPLPAASVAVASRTAAPEDAWVPLGAPPGAVPARAVALPAPDLSRGGPNALKRRPYIQGEPSRVPVAYGSVSAVSVTGRRRPLGAVSGRPLLRGGGAEEVVSAVVRVHPR